MRYGGALPGAETTAPAQHISSAAAIERFIAETGARLELEGTEPSTLRRVRERVRARAANVLAGDPHASTSRATFGSSTKPTRTLPSERCEIKPLEGATSDDERW